MQSLHPVKHGSVAVGPQVTPTVRLRPHLVLEGTRWPGMPRAATTTMTLKEIAAAVLVPVKRTTDNCHLRQATTDGWDRRLQRAPDLEKPPVFLPVIVSARNAWHLGYGRIEVFDNGYVIDGACRLESACRRGEPTLIPVVVLFGLTSDDELQLRSHVIRTKPGPPPSQATAQRGCDRTGTRPTGARCRHKHPETRSARPLDNRNRGV